MKNLRVKTVCAGLSSFLLVALFLLQLSGCSKLGFGSQIDPVYGAVAYEYENFIAVDDFIINKESGEIFYLWPNTDSEYPKGNVFYHGEYSYKYVFEEEYFDQYTYLQTGFHDDEGGYRYYHTILTYGYDGKEISRVVDPLALSEEEVRARFLESGGKIADTYSFVVDVLWKHHSGYTGDDKGIAAVVEYAVDLYEKTAYEVYVNTKRMGDEVWFSIITTSDKSFNTGDGLMQGIQSCKIMKYCDGTSEFEVVFDYGRKKVNPVDFDSKGMYFYELKNNLIYVEYETGEETLIYDFEGNPHSFYVTDEFICASHYRGNVGSFFVYRKGVGVVADDVTFS